MPGRTGPTGGSLPIGPWQPPPEIGNRPIIVTPLPEPRPRTTGGSRDTREPAFRKGYSSSLKLI